MSEALQNSNSLDTPIQFIKGVGPKRAKVLESLNIFTIKDLLYYFPRKYLDRTSLSTIGSISEGDEVNLVGRVKSVNLRRMKKGNFVTAVTKFPFFILLRFTDLTLPTKFTSSPSLIDPIVERDVLSKYFRGK